MPWLTTADDVRLHYTDEGAGLPVVLVGGFAMAASGWALQRRALADRYRVVALDRRAHGDSDRVPRGMRLARHAKDLRELLDQLALDRAVLVGASMGASVLWSYLDLFGTDLVAGVVTVDQTPKMVNDGDWDLGLYDLRPETVGAFVAEFPGAHNPFHRMPPLEVVQLLRGDADVPYDLLRPLLLDHTVADWRDVPEGLDVPLLAIAGRHSPLWPCASSQYLADAAAKGRCIVLEDSGHVPFLEQPEAFNEALLSFLAETAQLTVG